MLTNWQHVYPPRSNQDEVDSPGSAKMSLVGTMDYVYIYMYVHVDIDIDIDIDVDIDVDIDIDRCLYIYR